MNRWHKVVHGRIVASCECVTGDAAAVLLGDDRRGRDGTYRTDGLIVSDAQWRGTMYRKALLRVGTKKPDAEQRMADMRRRANDVQA